MSEPIKDQQTKRTGFQTSPSNNSNNAVQAQSDHQKTPNSILNEPYDISVSTPTTSTEKQGDHEGSSLKSMRQRGPSSSRIDGAHVNCENSPSTSKLKNSAHAKTSASFFTGMKKNATSMVKYIAEFILAAFPKNISDSIRKTYHTYAEFDIDPFKTLMSIALDGMAYVTAMYAMVMTSMIWFIRLPILVMMKLAVHFLDAARFTGQGFISCADYLKKIMNANSSDAATQCDGKIDES
ncbi:hypothetical protein O5D80_004402 [Batrachochytrium dendrobatidis]|nr:hypothetical protein O5D80_004402 [Batrachochytrium dendrobatidis]